MEINIFNLFVGIFERYYYLCLIIFYVSLIQLTTYINLYIFEYFDNINKIFKERQKWITDSNLTMQLKMEVCSPANKFKD